jgi:malate dehydrogenase (oxaloacetate-decarboxylating)(NADP+)
MYRRNEVLEYHGSEPKGKLEISATKPLVTPRELAMAYFPGVAEISHIVTEKPNAVYDYTSKENLIAVITNGSHVIGLGNIGALAAKSIMEGKCLLFKRFANVNAIDIEIAAQDPQEFVNVVANLEPSFGGICLEGLRAPDCFYIEEELTKRVSIPVLQSDQYGAAIIACAGLKNALLLQNKAIEDLKIVITGTGGEGLATARLLLAMGARKEGIMVVDSTGVLYKGRLQNMNPHKEQFVTETNRRTLAEALNGSDCFIGCSVGGIVTKNMVANMNDRPIIFCLAGPAPEIVYSLAKEARPDAIIGTRQSEFPNEFNNVLCIPYVFRGALDTRCSRFDPKLLIAAAEELAAIAREGGLADALPGALREEHRFGPEYIIPKPFDPRLPTRISEAVARAAVDAGVARVCPDFPTYRSKLSHFFSRSNVVMQQFITRAQKETMRILFPEGETQTILRACQAIVDNRIAQPVLLGSPQKISDLIRRYNLDLLEKVEIVDPSDPPNFEIYCQEVYELRKRKGLTFPDARDYLKNLNCLAMAMLNHGDVDGVISGQTTHYPETIRPALRILGLQKGVRLAASMYLVILKDRVKAFADTTINISPDAEDLAEIAMVTADSVRRLGVTPRLALLSFSSFGSSNHPQAAKVASAAAIVKTRRPDLEADGEIQADVALNSDLIRELYPFCRLTREANTLIFPDLGSANIAYKLMERIGSATVVGPILLGLRKPVGVLQRSCSVESVVNNTAVVCVKAQGLFERDTEQEKEFSLTDISAE